MKFLFKKNPGVEFKCSLLPSGRLSNLEICSIKLIQTLWLHCTKKSLNNTSENFYFLFSEINVVQFELSEKSLLLT